MSREVDVLCIGYFDTFRRISSTLAVQTRSLGSLVVGAKVLVDGTNQLWHIVEHPST
jgi:hypothetical protein